MNESDPIIIQIITRADYDTKRLESASRFM